MKPYPTIKEVEKRVGFKEVWWPTHCTNEDIIRHICDLDRERRGGEGDSIPWAAYRWAKWAAKDGDGGVGLHERDPTIASTEHQFWRCDGRTVYPRIPATIPGPWQESLRKRPEGV